MVISCTYNLTYKQRLFKKFFKRIGPRIILFRHCKRRRGFRSAAFCGSITVFKGEVGYVCLLSQNLTRLSAYAFTL